MHVRIPIAVTGVLCNRALVSHCPTPPNLPPNPNNMLPASFYNANTQAVLNITDIYNLKQLITDPTRITPLGSSLIDVSFTNLPDNTNCSRVSHIGISDHSLI